MTKFRATYSFDTIQNGTYEGEAVDKDAFEFQALNEIRDMDDASHNVEIISIDEI